MAQITRFFPNTLGKFSGDGSGLTNISSASYAVTASYALSSAGTFLSASYASSASVAVSSSYATTASFALNGGGGSTSPGGLNTQIQFNSASIFSGSSALTFTIGGGGGGIPITPNALSLTGSLLTTGSLFLIGQGSFTSLPSYTTSDFFLVRNATTTLKVIDGIQVTSSAEIPLQIFNSSNNNLLQISQSGVVIFATSSVILTGTAPNGAIYFTSSSFYVGLE
jgi:hypothetical protein